MKSHFKSFLNPSAAELNAAWTSVNTVFIFDTNVLLNLYGFKDQTRKDFFSTLEKLEGKIFIPYHVGLEYSLHRLSVIKNEKKTFREMAAITSKLEGELGKKFESLGIKEKLPEVAEFADQLRSDIAAAVAKFQGSTDPWNKQQPDVRSEDRILDKIHDLTDGRIGSPPTDQAWLDNIYAEGAARYEKLIPPGFRDIGKDTSEKRPPTFTHNTLAYERKYGDLIIWMQILEHANNKDINNVFFVTDDAKDDWWSIIDSGGDKTIGPHEGLRSEIYKLENINLFHMYSTSDFMDSGRSILKIDIQQLSINDAVNKHLDDVKPSRDIIELEARIRKTKVMERRVQQQRLAHHKMLAHKAYIDELKRSQLIEKYEKLARASSLLDELSPSAGLDSPELRIALEAAGLNQDSLIKMSRWRSSLDSVPGYDSHVEEDSLENEEDPDDDDIQS